MFGLPLWKLAACAAVLVALSGAAWKFRHGGVLEGRAEIQAKWDKERDEATAAALIASETRRVETEALITTNTKVINDYIAQKNLRAADAVLSAGKLRDLQATLDRARSQQAPTAAGAAPDPRLDIIAECSSVAGKLDDKVKSLAGTLTGLQAYVSGVCLAP